MEERKRFLIEVDIKGAETMFGTSPLHICIPLPLATLVTSDKPYSSSVCYAFTEHIHCDTHKQFTMINRVGYYIIFQITNILFTAQTLAFQANGSIFM